MKIGVVQSDYEYLDFTFSAPAMTNILASVILIHAVNILMN
jgi:hypothetical protein